MQTLQTLQTLQTAEPCPKSELISVFITNLSKYNDGELVGQWLDLPATDGYIQKIN